MLVRTFVRMAAAAGVLLASLSVPAQNLTGMTSPSTTSSASGGAGAPQSQGAAGFTGSSVSSSLVVPPAQTQPQVALPPVTSSGAGVQVFGAQMFMGRFGALNFTGFNPEYQLAVGDRVLVRMWGALTYEAGQNVDAQGNIFLPNVGPIAVLGVRNRELNRQVEEQVRRTFKSNVGVYATLDSSQSVKIYVTGFVRAPGLYAGLSSDSVMSYLDRAGGIDPDRGSFLTVQVLRGGKLRAAVNLYRFLLEGVIDSLQLQDGDTLVVQGRQHAVTVTGEAQNAYIFEVDKPEVAAADIIRLAQPKPTATHLSVVRNTGVRLTSEYYPLAEAGKVTIRAGDLVTFTADKYTATLLVRVNGAQMGERSLVLPSGATLKDLMARLNPTAQANLDAVQLFRRSVQERQRQSLNLTLRNIEVAALTARSGTTEEASLRKAEADMLLTFVERARQVQPLGQVVLTSRTEAEKVLLEDGDVINIPEKNNLVLLSGEVMFPNAQVYTPGASVEDYVRLAGGFTPGANISRQVVLRPNGAVADADAKPLPGDEIIVLPKVDTKYLEITRSVTQVIYQIAVAAKLALGL